MNRLISIILLVTASVSTRWQPILQTRSSPVPPAAAASPSRSQPESRLGLDGPVRAEDVFKNIEVFKGKPATQVLVAMNAIRGTLGVSCIYCHRQYEWEKNDKPAKETTRKMFRMLGYIEGTYFDHQNKVTCWTCHRGHAEQPRVTEKPAEQAEQYIHLTPQEQLKPAEEVFHNIQILKGVRADKLPFVMNFFSQSLGVRCSHCHIVNQWEKDDVAAKKTARNMLNMVHDVLRAYYGGNGPISCSGCHQGKVKPENGLEPAPATP